ncbi:hypothetical protein chiPu_0016257 [Chiloscyllium punctatum]|uniref:Uncharacterized protein n=1 Tax=Chiloscyllium punctatum TaxID=137246 RepID=A0A401T514_CHIPU|nr:hypothetical protein [Chiloscyllium punctatum]
MRMEEKAVIQRAEWCLALYGSERLRTDCCLPVAGGSGCAQAVAGGERLRTDWYLPVAGSERLRTDCCLPVAGG